MLVRILNTLRSRIWDRVFFLFSDYPNLQLVRMGIAQKAMVFIRMNISRRRYFLTRLYKNYIYLLLPHGEFFLWLTLIIFWRIPFSFQQKSLICYLLLKIDRLLRQNGTFSATEQNQTYKNSPFFTIVSLQFSRKLYYSGCLTSSHNSVKK